MLVFRISSLTAESLLLAHCSIKVVRFSSVIRPICLSYAAMDIFVIYIGARTLRTLDVCIRRLAGNFNNGILVMVYLSCTC